MSKSIFTLISREVRSINRQRYMAELTKLLSFMFKEDRSEIIKDYNELLDKAEDEEALLETFGSPTKLAVTIARSYNSGEYKPPELPEGIKAKGEESIPEETESSEEAEAPEVEPDKAPEVAPEVSAEEISEPEPEEQDIEVEIFEEEPEAESSEAEAEVTEEESIDAPEEPAPEEAEVPEEAVSEPEELVPEVVELQPASEEEPEMRTKTNVGLLILYLIPAIPVGAALLLCMLGIELAIVAAGLGVIFVGFMLLRFSFSGMQVFADIIICLGATIAVLAIGVLLAWLGVWLIAVSVPGLVKGVISLGRRFCVREVKDNG